MKAFAYVNPDEREGRRRRAADRARQGAAARRRQDLLARMKDYITQPDRIVNVKNALDATVTPRQTAA